MRIGKRVKILTFFAFGTDEVGLTFADIGSKEGCANPAIFELGIPNFSNSIFALKMIAGQTYVSRNSAGIQSHFHQIFYCVAVDYQTLQSTF